MSLLDRLSNVFKGLAEEKLSAVEADNPDVVYSAAVDAAERRLAELKERLVGLMAQQGRRSEDDRGLSEAIAETRAALKRGQEELTALKRERTRSLAQRELAAAQVAVNDLRDGLSEQVDIQAVGNVRTSIERTHEKAHEGWLDSEGRPVHARVQRLSKQAAEDKARAELDRLKALRDEGTEAVFAEE